MTIVYGWNQAKLREEENTTNRGEDGGERGDRKIAAGKPSSKPPCSDGTMYLNADPRSQYGALT